MVVVEIEGFGRIVLQGHDNAGNDREEEAYQRSAAPGMAQEPAEWIGPAVTRAQGHQIVTT
jgi:hypothetical protein